MKKVLVISSSPRRNGNSDTLCNAFMKGAEEAGNTVEKIFLGDKKIHYCTGCGVCTEGRPCPQKDDAASILEKMIASDVIVLGTPVYFYAMSAQLKTLIDRCCGPYTKIRDKEFYFIATAAEEGGEFIGHVFDNLQGFLDCLPNPVVKGKILCGGVWKAGEVQNKPELKEAFEMGRGV